MIDFGAAADKIQPICSSPLLISALLALAIFVFGMMTNVHQRSSAHDEFVRDCRAHDISDYNCSILWGEFRDQSAQDRR